MASAAQTIESTENFYFNTQKDGFKTAVRYTQADKVTFNGQAFVKGKAVVVKAKAEAHGEVSKEQVQGASVSVDTDVEFSTDVLIVDPPVRMVQGRDFDANLYPFGVYARPEREGDPGYVKR